MRVLLALIFFVAVTGCESDVPPAQNRSGNPLERGISGKGTLTQPDKSEDPLIKGGTPPAN
jgi:hypothetical protein